MSLLLDVLYGLALLIASPVLLVKMAIDRRYRHRLGERFGGVPRRFGDGPCLWLHCASVGEVNVARPLVKELSKRRPDLALHVSTTTMAGRKTAKKTFGMATIHYWPLDFSFAIRRAFRRVRPTAVCLVELEVWPNFVRIAEGKGIPVVVVNGRMSSRSHRRYRRFTWFFRGAFRRLTAVAAQTRSTADRLAELGVPASRITVGGNLKFDNTVTFDPTTAGAEIRKQWGIGADEPVLVAGSTHEPEERILLEAWRLLRADHPKLRFLVAPRHLERVDEVTKILQCPGTTVVRRSTLSSPPSSDSILLLDTVGELAKTYAAADVVFIGGTFCDRGGQNMLEPAALGKPVVSGPSLENFREIADALSKEGGMRILSDPSQLAPALGEWLKDRATRTAVGTIAREVSERGRGALAGTLRVLEGALPAVNQP